MKFFVDLSVPKLPVNPKTTSPLTQNIKIQFLKKNSSELDRRHQSAFFPKKTASIRHVHPKKSTQHRKHKILGYEILQPESSMDPGQISIHIDKSHFKKCCIFSLKKSHGEGVTKNK